jgi:hypothetical protein
MYETRPNPDTPIAREFSLDNPIPPLSVIKFVHGYEDVPSWGNKSNIGKEYRVGYYNPNDGLDVVWLVDHKGNYIETTDQSSMNINFRAIEISKETDLFGINREKIPPLDCEMKPKPTQ